jgi:hypothetical protein
MDHYCKNHPNKKALSFCHVCNEYYCEGCLNEGKEYYYCNQTTCYNEYFEERRLFNESYETNPRFCPKCIEETLPESIGNLETINFVGTSLFYIGNRCNICNSYVASKSYIILGFPAKKYDAYRIIDLKKYRTLPGSETTFIARKIKEQNKY